MGIFKKESMEEKQARIEERNAKWQKEFEELKVREEAEKEEAIKKEQHEQEMLRLREERKNIRTKNLIYSCEFQSGTKTVVNVYKNRIEFMHTSIKSMMLNGVTGRTIIYLKNLAAIEMLGDKIEFISAGFFHNESEINKHKADNVITFNSQEIDLAAELIDVINDLM